MATSKVLHEGMPGDDHSGAAVLLEPSHRMQPRFEAAVVGLAVVLAIPTWGRQSPAQQPPEHRRVHRGVVGDPLDWCDLHRADGALEEPAGRGRVPPRGHEHVDDLPELVDRAVDVAPLPATLT